jgi:hypothetical protein
MDVLEQGRTGRFHRVHSSGRIGSFGNMQIPAGADYTIGVESKTMRIRIGFALFHADGTTEVTVSMLKLHYWKRHNAMYNEAAAMPPFI